MAMKGLELKVSEVYDSNEAALLKKQACPLDTALFAVQMSLPSFEIILVVVILATKPLWTINGVDYCYYYW